MGEVRTVSRSEFSVEKLDVHRVACEIVSSHTVLKISPVDGRVAL